MDQMDHAVFLNYISKGVGTVSDNNRNACPILQLKMQKSDGGEMKVESPTMFSIVRAQAWCSESRACELV
jgi:hypothetical protein